MHVHGLAFVVALTGLALANAACSAESGESPGAASAVQAGCWGGAGIRFRVEPGGRRVCVYFADLGACSAAGCESSRTFTCESCCAELAVREGRPAFEGSGCTGSFASPSAAAGHCSGQAPDCDCAFSQDWSAAPEAPKAPCDTTTPLGGTCLIGESRACDCECPDCGVATSTCEPATATWGPCRC